MQKQNHQPTLQPPPLRAIYSNRLRMFQTVKPSNRWRFENNSVKPLNRSPLKIMVSNRRAFIHAVRIKPSNRRPFESNPFQTVKPQPFEINLVQTVRCSIRLLKLRTCSESLNRFKPSDLQSWSQTVKPQAL